VSACRTMATATVQIVEGRGVEVGGLRDERDGVLRGGLGVHGDGDGTGTRRAGERATEGGCQHAS
jgi:hypothetical protein